MPSEADALEEKSALSHKSKANSTGNNKTASKRTSPTLRKVLPDPQSVTYKHWRFHPTFSSNKTFCKGVEISLGYYEEAVVSYLFAYLTFGLVKGSPGWICFKASVYVLVNTILFVGCKSSSPALLISLCQELSQLLSQDHWAGQLCYSFPATGR